MIIYVQHLQLLQVIRYRQVLVHHTKSMEKIMLNQHILKLICKLIISVGPPPKNVGIAKPRFPDP